MGTRSDIIVHRADGQWARIYCHWDGYPEHNGAILHEHYTTQEKCDALVALGDISSLAPEIGEKHDFEWRSKLVCAKTDYGDKLTPAQKAKKDLFENMVLAYGRDRGETGIDATVGDSLSAVWPGSDTGTEFTYVYADPEDGKGKRWLIGDPDEGQQTLRDLGAVLAGEEEPPATAIKAFGGNFVIGHR